MISEKVIYFGSFYENPARHLDQLRAIFITTVNEIHPLM